MKVAWQSFEMICRRRVALILLLLLCLQSSFADVYPSVYVPIGVGHSQEFAKLTEFGHFDKDYVTCGQKTKADMSEEHKGSSIDFAVHCEPHPERIIVADGNTDYGKYQRDLKKECELMTCSANDYMQKGANMGSVANGKAGSTATAPQPENPAMSVCGSKMAKYSNGATGTMLFANEGACFASYPNLVNTVSKSTFKQVPRWLDASKEQFFTMRPFYYTGEQPAEKNFQASVDYHFSHIKDMGDLGYKDCLTACDSGKLVKLTMAENYAYWLRIHLKGSCKAFRICLDPFDFDDDTKVPRCKSKQVINVLVENGVVVWPNDHRASLIELKASKHQDVHPVVMEFGWNKNFYVMNDHRERVQTDVVTAGRGGYNAKMASRLAFFFPEENCLQSKAGFYSNFISVGKALTSKQVVKGQPKTHDGKTIKVTDETKIKEEEVPEPIQNIVLTTTVAPLIVLPGAVSLAEGNQLESDIGSAAFYVAGKWWVWGMYIGFVIGTLLTLGLGGGIFYLLRRTVFGVWYRGMYKRYGCDVSGTTGGITGVGFGNTMTGDMTVKGTSGGTTAGTTGGGTTGSMSTMSKTSTLAM